MSWKPALGALALVSVMMLVLALASPVQALPQRGNRPKTMHTATETPPLPPLQERIDAIATADFPDAYAGDVLEPSGSVTVYVTSNQLTDLTSELATSLGASLTSDYTVLAVANSFNALEALTSQIAKDEPSLSAQGIQMTSWGPAVEDNKVLVTVSSPTPRDIALLQARYGANLVEIAASTGTLPVRDQTDRFADTEPYYGGDAIWFDGMPNGTLCTDAFGITQGGETSSITDGHCNGIHVDTNIDNPRQVGTIWFYQFVNRGPDVEMFYCDCTGTVWANGTSTHPVTGSVSAGKGSLVTMDGAASGEVTGNAVQQVNYCQKFSDGLYTCNVSRTYQAGVVACQGGDSGGPVYQRISGSSDVDAVGVIVGSTDNGQTCIYSILANLLSLVHATLLTS